MTMFQMGWLLIAKPRPALLPQSFMTSGQALLFPRLTLVKKRSILGGQLHNNHSNQVSSSRSRQYTWFPPSPPHRQAVRMQLNGCPLGPLWPRGPGLVLWVRGFSHWQPLAQADYQVTPRSECFLGRCPEAGLVQARLALVARSQWLGSLVWLEVCCLCVWELASPTLASCHWNLGGQAPRSWNARLVGLEVRTLQDHRWILAPPPAQRHPLNDLHGDSRLRGTDLWSRKHGLH